jgi:Protein of unknown function (DUF4230)
MATLSPPPPAHDRRPSNGPAIVLALLLGLIAGAVILVFCLRQATHGAWNELATRLTGRSLNIDTSQPTVVARIQSLQRLDTVSYTMDKVVEGDREGRVLPEFLTGDKILLVVHGHAIAGVDLARLASDDLAIREHTVYVHLPAPEIFTVALDNEKTRVYSRTTGILVPVDPNLESEVRAKAEQDLRASALAAGILATAHGNACTTLRTLLLGLGFAQVQCD